MAESDQRVLVYVRQGIEDCEDEPKGEDAGSWSVNRDCFSNYIVGHTHDQFVVGRIQDIEYTVRLELL